MQARVEFDYVDQVPRRQAYEAAHPNVEIHYKGPYWKAIIGENSGQTTITRIQLRQLLDALESLDAYKPGGKGEGLSVNAIPAEQASSLP